MSNEACQNRKDSMGLLKNVSLTIFAVSYAAGYLVFIIALLLLAWGCFGVNKVAGKAIL